MTTQPCSNCKHWLTNEDNNDCRVANSKEHGRCLAVIQNDSYAEGAELINLAQSPMIAMDGSDYFAALFTLPTHGCDSWEESE